MPVTAQREPLYRKLADRLAGMIRARALQPGDRIPSVRAFGRQHRVSVPTALHAYVTLETRGMIEARPKSGFFVRSALAALTRTPALPRSVPKLTDFAGLDPFDVVLLDHNDGRLVPLGAAVPGPDLLPAARLQRMMGAISRRLGPASLAYDFAPGSVALRRAIARRTLEWGGALEPDDLIVTNGGTEALSLALEATCAPGDTVLVEAPTYFGIARMLRDLNLRALPIPVDSTTGIDVDQLVRALERERVAACVLIPNFHNPVGCLIPDDRKKLIARILDARGVPLIEDDIYGDLQHEGARPRCIKAEDDSGSVLLCGSFSKTLAPGYRVGYIAPGRWYRRVLALKRSRSLANATLPALVIADFIRNGGYDRYLRRVRRSYRDQVARMRVAAAESFPEGTAMTRPAGGFVLWCELPTRVDATRLFEAARRAGISVTPGAMFGPDGGFAHCLRISCGHRWSDRTARAMQTLGQLMRRQMR